VDPAAVLILGALKAVPLNKAEQLAAQKLGEMNAELQKLIAETERDICKRAGIDPCRVNWQAGMAEEVLRPEVEKK